MVVYCFSYCLLVLALSIFVGLYFRFHLIFQLIFRMLVNLGKWQWFHLNHFERLCFCKRWRKKRKYFSFRTCFYMELKILYHRWKWNWAISITFPNWIAIPTDSNTNIKFFFFFSPYPYTGIVQWEIDFDHGMRITIGMKMRCIKHKQQI